MNTYYLILKFPWTIMLLIMRNGESEQGSLVMMTDQADHARRGGVVCHASVRKILDDQYSYRSCAGIYNHVAAFCVLFYSAPKLGEHLKSAA